MRNISSHGCGASLPIDIWRNLKFTAAFLAASAANLTGGSKAEAEAPPPSPSAARAPLTAPTEQANPLADLRLPLAGGFIDSRLHTAAEFREEAQKLVKEYPTLAALIELGESATGRPLWGIRISDNVSLDEHEPKTLYIAGIHGDERVQPELMLALCRYLLSTYAQDQRVKELIDNSALTVVICANPDGWELGTRNNANDVDINRDFPSIHAGRRISTKGRQPETVAMMNLVSNEHFGLLIDFHGTTGGRGVVFVNTPYDNEVANNLANRFSDYQLAVTIAHAYADANPRMRECNNSYLCNGVTVGGGAAWFQAPTGPDCYSDHFDTTAITVEVSNPKGATVEEIRDYFATNLTSMLVCLEAAQLGYHFEVIDERGQPIQNATVTVSSSHRNITFDAHHIHRLAPRGKHEVIVTKWGYEPAVVWADSSRFDGTFTKVTLRRTPTD
jgi:carboxypeptidase D